MNPIDLINDLQSAHKTLEDVKKTQRPIEDRVIADEIPLVRKFAELLFPFAKKKTVHGEEAVLIYVFSSKEKTLISPEVYLKRNGEVVYEVYDESGYRRFRPSAIIEDGYNIIDLNEFLRYCSFQEIYSFYKERVDHLYEQAEEIVNFNKSRNAFVEKMKEFFY